ncbi:DUF2264 domain-containing protein [Jeotgalibaca sp. YN-L-12]|nr:DUF2264 domain-containing protein [Jeotgalibaca caeni]
MLMNNLLKENDFESKKDFQGAFEALMTPLLPYYTDGRKGRLKLGTGGAVYTEDVRQIEAFLRPLWGLGPYLVDHHHPELESDYLEGIRAGTDPQSEDYWGKTNDYDQRLVEMASLANLFLLTKEKTWDLFSAEEQENIYRWLMQINQHTIPLSNWLFFRILVNLAMKNCGKDWDEDRVRLDLEIIDSCYIGNGWYYDENPTQMDYYISFAIHYYSLIYYKFMKKEDPVRTTLIKERAIQFAQTFKYWFDEKGEALPFGRSLSYRFSQCAFWTALVYADIQALPWGEIKGIISRHMKSWMAKDIFNKEGLLTIGYHYPNLIMAEGYNAPGSPYWSLKSFLLLAVADAHPYWQAETTPIQYPLKQIAIPEARMLITTSKNQNQAYVAGQLEQKQAHVDAKYSKLVYSTTFGISVSKGSVYYKQGGFDSCLALSEEDTYYRSKLGTDRYHIHRDYVVHEWRPWKDVSIQTVVIPIDTWHVRIHKIKNQRYVHAVEGGFSVPVEENDRVILHDEGIEYESRVGTSSLYNISGYMNPIMQVPEPNTNLYFDRSVYPIMEAKLEVGEHCLISLVGGSVEKNETIPTVKYENNTIEITYGETKKIINLTDEV